MPRHRQTRFVFHMEFFVSITIARIAILPVMRTHSEKRAERLGLTSNEHNVETPETTERPFIAQAARVRFDELPDRRGPKGPNRRNRRGPRPNRHRTGGRAVPARSEGR